MQTKSRISGPPVSKQTLSTQIQTSYQSRVDLNEKPRSDQTRYKSFFSLLLHTLVISLSSFYFGYIIAYMSSVEFNTVIKVYSITFNKQAAQGLLNACIPVGGGIGALASRFFINTLSRRNNLLFVNILAILSGLIIYVQRIQIFFIGRLMQGVCAGFFSSLAPLIMKQLSPNQISGTLTSFNQIFIAFGVFFAFVFSLIISIIYKDSSAQSTWWIIFGLPLVFLTLQTFLLIFIYPFQTPKYLYQNKQQQKGRQLVQRIYKPQYVNAVIREIKENLGQPIQQTRRYDSDKSQTFTLSGFPETEKNKNSTPKAAVVVALHLAALQQFCGINAVIAYGGQIVGQGAPTIKLVLPILINLQQVIAAIFTSYLLTVIGRKALLQVGSLMACVGCSVIAIGFFIQNSHPGIAINLIVFGLVLFMANFGFTLGPVVWVYLPEIVQPNVLPYATMVNWASAAFIMLLFPVIKQTLPNKNPAYLFLFFAVWCTLSYFFNKKFIIQTKDKQQKQIFEQYRSGRKIQQI